MKKLFALFMSVAMVACMAVPAFAADVCVGEYDYTIGSGSTTWNGKDKDKLFGLYAGNATWHVSNTNNTPTVNAYLMKIRTLAPDKEVARMSTIGKQPKTATFVAKDTGYYAKITASNNRGTTGRTWIDQDSSIVNLRNASMNFRNW